MQISSVVSTNLLSSTLSMLLTRLFVQKQRLLVLIESYVKLLCHLLTVQYNYSWFSVSGNQVMLDTKFTDTVTFTVRLLKVIQAKVKMKMAVFWVVAPCSLVEVCQHFRGHRPDDGGSKDLRNVGKLLPDYTVLQPRRQPSSYSPPWESQILLCQDVMPWVPNIAAHCTQRTGAISLTDITIRVQGIESAAPVRVLSPESCASQPLSHEELLFLTKIYRVRLQYSCYKKK
jgi:hypothetical protein